MTLPTSRESWKKVAAHYEAVGKAFLMKDLFASDPTRFDTFSATFTPPGAEKPAILLDYSKNIITRETLTLL
ncbi:glucose-6-phosphate isomerase, partial [Cladochytrium tenue]